MCVGERLAARREARRLPLGLGDLELVQLLQKHERTVVFGIPRRQGVGGQSEDVSIVAGFIRMLADVLHRLLQLLGAHAAVGQRPDDVARQEKLGIAHLGDGLAVCGADVGPGAVRFALLHEPLLGSVDDAAVDGVDFGHVVEFLQAVGAEPDNGRAAPPPVKAAAGPFKREKLLVADVQVIFSGHQDLGRGHTGLLEVIHGQDIRIGRG